MIIFDLQEGLRALLEDALDVEVYEVYPVTDSAEPSVTVGGSLSGDRQGRVDASWYSSPWGDREEAIQIPVSVMTRTGDSSPRSAQDECRRIVNAIHAALTADPSAGVEAEGMDPQFMRSEIELFQGVDDELGGWFVEAVLTVHFKALTAYL